MVTHSDHVLRQLGDQLRLGFLCDVVVTVGGVPFRAHRSVLAACSAYFRRLFISQPALPWAQCQLSPELISPTDFDCILQMMYTGVPGQESDIQPYFTSSAPTNATRKRFTPSLLKAMAYLEFYTFPGAMHNLPGGQGAGESSLLYGLNAGEGEVEEKEDEEEKKKEEEAEGSKDPEMVFMQKVAPCWKQSVFQTSAGLVIVKEYEADKEEDGRIVSVCSSPSASSSSSACPPWPPSLLSLKVMGNTTLPFSPGLWKVDPEAGLERGPGVTRMTRSAKRGRRALTGTNGQKHTCPTCGRFFKRHKMLQRHRARCLGALGPARAQLKARDHTCATCGKAFMQKGHLREHEGTHSAVKRFSCAACGRQFVRLRELRVHEARHRGQASYHCHVCGHASYRKNGHYHHLVTHLRPPTTLCQVCFFTCQGTQELKEHQMEHCHLCEECGARFRLKKDLTAHLAWCQRPLGLESLKKSGGHTRVY
ncbi:hypothetical protein AAFF_G00312970 [Aldrovandia affinis]|uniref:Uncharacterized protein n=1 Tax=Aldrovandia affinis TaxID=143900 RepID=A0AAD7SNG0_9TELE|nr:hypothetical protein AAFF_G00312970 [Aldrovandia affinis]